MSTNVTYIRGNIFASRAQSLVNTVNCVGVMGAGIALEFRYRYPEMFQRYVKFCEDGLMKIGSLYIYEVPEEGRKVINFPTKKDWKHQSKPEFLIQGLEKFLETYRERGITSAAFPLLGAQNGGLDNLQVRGLMTDYLSKADIPIEIYEFTPDAKDDLIAGFIDGLLYNKNAFKHFTGLRDSNIEKLRKIVSSGELISLIQLTKIKGFGEETIKACFRFAMKAREVNIIEEALWPPEALPGETVRKAVEKSGNGKKPATKEPKPRIVKILSIEQKQLLTDLPVEIIQGIEAGSDLVTVSQLKAYAAGMKMTLKKLVMEKYLTKPGARV